MASQSSHAGRGLPQPGGPVGPSLASPALAQQGQAGSTQSNSGLAACPCTNELYQIDKALIKFNEALTKPYPWLDRNFSIN